MIGVFDSGFGGLTILRALQRLPEKPDLVYFGDNARAPYGNRSGPEIAEFTRQGVDRLFQQGCRLVVIGCNTASAIALRELQRNWLPYRPGPKCNVLGIIVPTIEQATGVSWGQKTIAHGFSDDHDIAVFATSRTVESRVYPIEISKRRLDITVHQEACPTLAPAIESGADQNALSEIVQGHVSALLARTARKPRRVILGCTHYTLLRDFFAKALGPEVEIIDQPQAVAVSLSSYLGRHPELEIPLTSARQAKPQGSVRFLTSGFVPKSLHWAELFWGNTLSFQQLM